MEDEESVFKFASTDKYPLWLFIGVVVSLVQSKGLRLNLILKTGMQEGG